MLTIFFKTGNLKIQTLHGCRTIEDKIRQDSHDGIATLNGEPDKKGVIKDNDNITIRVEKEGMDPQKMRVNLKVDAPDGYLFCMSSEKSKKLLERFDVNSLFAINDLPKFSNAINDYFEKARPMDGTKTGQVYYDNMTSTSPSIAETMYYPEFRKSSLFAIEKEWRVVFRAKSAINYQPTIITCPEAISYCSTVDIGQLD